jgi:ribosomal protein S26
MSSNITRKKGQSGRARSVECASCGALVPRDKAIAKRRFGLSLNRRLMKILKNQGARIHAGRTLVFYCISCAKHRKYV